MGVPDVAEFSLIPKSAKMDFKVVTYRSVLFSLIWQKQYSLFPKRSELVFLLATRIMTYTSDLPHITVNQLVAKAFKIWSEVIPLTFKRVKWGTADIMIGFARRGKEDSFRLILCAVLLVVYIHALLFSRFKIFNEI